MTQTDENKPDAPPAGGAEGHPTSDLDSLLEGFKNATDSSKELDPVIEFAKGAMAEKQQEALDKDVASAVETIQGADETLKEIDADLIEGLMETFAKKDPSFVKAFKNRGENPRAWQEALVEGGKFAAGLLSKLPQSKVRSDVEAAKAAVDGTSTDTTPSDDEPDIAEIQALSDFDFQQRLKQEVAKASR